MKKIVINKCHGGFGLSHEAIVEYLTLKGLKFSVKTSEHPGLDYEYIVEGFDDGWYDRHDIERDDPVLVQVVEKMGDAANDRFSELKVVEIPNDVHWEIGEYDGKEWVAEKHRIWS